MVDPIQIISSAARELEGVEEGTSCTQASFKVNGKAFLFAGMQGGRCKMMLKLRDSIEEAEELAKELPEDFQVGSGWVTVRFAKEKPPAAKLWKKWLKESYRLAANPQVKKKK